RCGAEKSDFNRRHCNEDQFPSWEGQGWVRSALSPQLAILSTNNSPQRHRGAERGRRQKDVGQKNPKEPRQGTKPHTGEPNKVSQFAQSILDKERRIAEIVGNIKGLLARTK
ncbi:MAG: hypothetical protein AB1705_08090, partial [Verrucomicrobiota bacterium]